ncbi:MAG: hypothetical protein LBP39_00845, partial [Rickettsiales bacterium]|nr:hypothetical protein [Rickettsiales bacterium]
MEDENSKTLIYDGPYKEGIADGWVKVDYGYGRTFEGEFRNGEPFDGTMKYGDDLILKGKWENGQLCDGKETHRSGLILEGKFKDGQLYDGRGSYPGGIIAEGRWENGQLYDGKIIYADGDVSEGKWENSQLYDGRKTYTNGGVSEGKLENGQLYDGKRIYADGGVSEGKWENGQLYDGKRIYADGDVYEGKWENGQLYDGRKTYTDGTILEGKWENSQLYDGRKTYTNGIILEGKFKDGQLYDGKRIYANGDVSEGKWENGQLYDGKITYSDGDVYEVTGENDRPLDVSVELKLSDTGKSYCSYRIGKNNSPGKIEYHLEDDYGNVRVVTIDYGEINKILNGVSSTTLSTIGNLDDLIRNRVIGGVESFNELRDFAKEVLQDKMLGDIKKGFDGARGPLDDLLMLSSIDRVEELKRTRFQLEYTRKGEDSLRKEYGSLKDFLESVGININTVEEDYISLKVDTIPPDHTVSVILDIKKMKELKNLQPEKSLDEAIADKKVIHCFDSSR